MSETYVKAKGSRVHLLQQITTPTLREQDRTMKRRPWIEEDEFNPRYLKRSLHLLPKQGDHVPWIFDGDFYPGGNCFPPQTWRMAHLFLPGSGTLWRLRNRPDPVELLPLLQATVRESDVGHGE